MKTTFARIMTTAVILVITALLALGITFEVLARNLFRDGIQKNLSRDAEVISTLASVVTIPLISMLL